MNKRANEAMHRVSGTHMPWRFGWSLVPRANTLHASRSHLSAASAPNPSPELGVASRSPGSGSPARPPGQHRQHFPVDALRQVSHDGAAMNEDKKPFSGFLFWHLTQRAYWTVSAILLLMCSVFGESLFAAEWWQDASPEEVWRDGMEITSNLKYLRGEKSSLVNHPGQGFKLFQRKGADSL